MVEKHDIIMKYKINTLFNSNKRSDEEKRKNQSEYNDAADFEAAIAATGFGYFNIFLLFICVPTSFASIFETTTMSYVFPAAECDLNLSLEDKGMLNAVTYAGTITSAFLWGLLFDTYGRQRLLMIGFLLDGFFVVLSSLSQNIAYLMVMKFMGGFVINGPFAALTTYMSELHVSKYRSRIPLLIGICYSLGGIYLPLLGSYILPMKFKLMITEYFVLHSWGLFLLINAMPSLLSGAIFFILPESPKFLMSVGKNEEALEIFRKIYSINSGKPKETYPVKCLVEENRGTQQENPKVSTFKNGWNQIKPLFKPPLLKMLILVCSLQVFVTMSFNTLRLWLPQLFQAINDYKFFNNGTSATLCEMLNILHPEKKPKECFVNFENNEVYLSLMTVSVTTVFAYLLAGTLINILGQNKLLGITSFIAGSFAVGIYFAPSSLFAIICVAGFSSTSSISTIVILVAIVNLFPTTQRTMTVSLAMMFGRVGAMMGNIVFPYLLEIGCAQPFFAIASLSFACCIFTLLLPKKKTNFI